MSSYYRYTLNTNVIEDSIQILENSDFEIPHSNVNVIWQSSTGWGGSANPSIGGNTLAFTYTDRTVTQSVEIENYIVYSNALLEFEVARHPNKTDDQSIFHILINFRNSSNNILDTHRYPASGNANTSGVNWHKISDSFSLSNEDISTIEVRITARETGNWAGQYGPRFNYVKLFLS